MTNMNKFSRRGADIVFTPPTAPVKKIDAEVYEVEIPMMGAPFLRRMTGSVGSESLLDQSKAWDFEGSKDYEICMSDVEKFFNNEDYYRSIGVLHRRGVILHGPAGTGKTVIAKAMALKTLEMGFPVVYGNNTEELGVIALHGFPCLVWIDEIDQLEDMTRTIDRLSTGCFIVGTTNYPEAMQDRIIKRPGRFDRVLKIDRMTPGMIRNLCKKYFIEDAYSEIANNFATITPAMMAEVSLRYKVYGFTLSEAVKTVKEEFGG
jgi:hypothetical protein